MLLFLGRIYLWPAEQLPQDLTLAADQPERLGPMEIYRVAPAIADRIREEAAELRRRIPKPPPPPPPWKRWPFWK